MTTITDIRAERAARRPGILRIVREVLGEWRLYNRTLDELRSLNDRELADLGIARSDIQRIALETVYGSADRV
jgi:uncharacterized protein YjiS (DUF1127 family)